MRRGGGYLYSHAKELGCNKIALGHHFDDVIETIFMGILYGGQINTMMPKLRSTSFEGMELIRSLRINSPMIDANIMKSAENINLDACLGYVKKGVRHHFMDEYNIS